MQRESALQSSALEYCRLHFMAHVLCSEYQRHMLLASHVTASLLP